MARIAIVGMSCLFPGAPNIERYWDNIRNGVDAISDVPGNRWDASFYDPQSTAVDRFYCKRGGFVDAYTDFDPLAFGIMPKAATATEPDQLLTLKIGYEALRDAGYADKGFARDKTGVIIGRGNYITAGVLRLEQHVRLLPQMLQTLRDLFPDLSPEALETARERLKSAFSYYGPDVAAGMIPNLIASRLANRLDLHGPAYTVDAACASSLIAVEQACHSLARGDTDMMLVGGAHLTHDLTFWATFCQLGALSRNGSIKPFSKHADGILAGEGIGMAVLKRVEDAERDGDRIYAVVEGVGSSSDGRGSSLVAPSASGQKLALEKAWAEAGIGRETIGLVEAHGTGTPAGDEAELETLRLFFGDHDGKKARAVVGSVKSMIGHTMPAAGMAGLIKAALSIHHGVLPPTLHCETPHPRLASTRFRTIARAESWNTPVMERVAAVNAFGFGGINGHVVLRGVEAAPTLPEVLVLSADSPEQLLQRLERGERDATPGEGACRLAIVRPDEKKLALARKIIASGKPWHGRQQIYFTPSGLIGSGGKLAFVFPGFDSRFSPQARDLAAHFKRPLPPYCETLDPARSLAKVGLGLHGFNRFMFQILDELGIRADAVAGHSIGEWSAMLAAGMMDQALSDRTAAALDLDALKFADAQFLAAACSEEKLRAAMAGVENVSISHDNCPHQVICCGPRDAIAIVAARLRESAVLAQVLPIAGGFHSPLFADHIQGIREFFSKADLAEPRVPVWSATTAGMFPAAMVDKQQLAIDHLLKPVHFRALARAMHDDGCRVFVQVGTGSLTGFINDSLRDLPHLAVESNQENRSGLLQLVNLCASLWTEGAKFDTKLLRSRASEDKAPAPRAETGVKLSLGVPLVRVTRPLELTHAPRALTGAAAPLQVAANDAVGNLLRDTLADIERAGRDVLALWQKHQRNRSASASDALPINRRISRLLDVGSTIPYIRDHALHPQREGWPVAADCFLVIPMTMEVMLVREAVEELVPGMKAVEIRNVQAYNWLDVSAPQTVNIAVHSADGVVFDAEIEGYFRAQVLVAREFAAADIPPMPALINPRATEVGAEDLYRDSWMPHGPAYQGVVKFSGIGDNGIDGDLRVPAGKGALLDNMGQLAGYWVMEQPRDCLAMPIGVDSIRFFAPDPVAGEVLRDQVRVVQLDDSNYVCDQVLTDSDGAIRIAISGWRTRRYQMDKEFWVRSRRLSHSGISQAVPPNVALFDDRYETAIVRDYIKHRYLTVSEQAIYDGLQPRRRRQWLNGRVAAKDAVRDFVRERTGLVSLFPKELRIESDAEGAPHVVPNVTGNVPANLKVSISHKDTLAAAIVDEQNVGIDIERVEARDESFIAMTFSEAERRLLNDEDPAVAITRGWVAKECVAKSAGTGLGGQPRNFVIEARDGDCFQVNGRWVVTHTVREYIVGWTLTQLSSDSVLPISKNAR